MRDPIKLFLLLFSLSFGLPAMAQQFEATVVDARTREPLPFASIFIDRQNSTITNSTGRFSIQTDSSSVLKISYVGYKPLSIRADQLRETVALQTMDMGLQEVTVVPISNMIRKATKETLRQLQKNKKQKANFFYRQIAFADSTCYEFAEAFLSGRSAAWLRDLELVTGRYVGILPDSLHHYSFYTNFYTFSQIEVATKEKVIPYHETIIPLSRSYAQYYDVDYEVIRDDSTCLYAIHFVPKPKIKRNILDVTLYIDEQTLHLRKMEGVGRNTGLVHREWNKEKQRVVEKLIPTEFGFVVNMTDERDFMEVQSAYIIERHDLGDKQIDTRSILFNIGDRRTVFADNKEMSKKMSKGKRMEFYGNLHKKIKTQGYDSLFWRNNEIVLRTPVEQQVMELFERKNLFGVFK